MAEGLAATVLNKWMFVGTFADDHFTAGNRTLGPERGPVVNYSASYPDGYGNSVSWQPLSVTSWTGSPAPVRMPNAVAAQSVNKTTAFFLCTHVFVPLVDGAPTVDMVITGSTSSLATVSVNGVVTLTDRLISGRTLDEFSRQAVLIRGR
jgi:hypothetical protein